MSSNKTVETDSSVENFINAVDNEQKRKDSWDLIALMTEITGSEPKMWGSSLIGFGQYHYKYESGREGDMCRTGFSPRKAKHSIYLMGCYCNAEAGSKNDALLEKLGRKRLLLSDD